LRRVEQKHPVWSNVGQSLRVEDVGSGAIELRESRLRSLRQRLLIWDWFRISERDLTNPYVAKILLARDKLMGRGDAGAAIIIAAPYDEQADAAAKTLREFSHEMRPSIDATLAALASRERVSAR